MRIALVLPLVALLAVSGAGQSVYVPDANAASGPCSNQPLNYGVSWRYLYIVSQKTLGNRPLKILDVAFAPCNTTLFTAAQFQMRMAHTTATVTGPGCFDTILGAPVFCQYGGILSFDGIAAASISVPKLPALAGTRIYHAAVTYTTSITGCTNTVGTLIVP